MIGAGGQGAGDGAAGAPRIPSYRECNLVVFGAFLVFVVAKYMQWGARREIFATIRLEFLLGLALGAACIAILSSGGQRIRSDRGVIIGISLLFLAMLMQLPFAAAPTMARTVFVDRVVKFAMLTLFMAVLIQSPRYLYFFLGAFLFSCFYVTQESVQGLISGGLVWQNQGIMRLHGAVPIYEHPNSLGGVAMGAVPFVIFLFPVLRRWYLRAFLLGLLGTSLTCVVYSGSRTAYVALVAFLFYWWLMSRRKLRFVIALAVALPVLLLAVPEEYKERFRTIGGAEEAEGHSRDARIRILQDAWYIFQTHPFGVGVASFPAVRWQVFGRYQDTHNLYLEVATNLGVQGLAIFLYLVFRILVRYRLAHRSLARQLERVGRYARDGTLSTALRRRLGRHREELALMMAVCKAAGGFVFVRLVLGFFGMDLYEIYWWFAAGLALCLTSLAWRSGLILDRLAGRIDAERAAAGAPAAGAGA